MNRLFLSVLLAFGVFFVGCSTTNVPAPNPAEEVVEIPDEFVPNPGEEIEIPVDEFFPEPYVGPGIGYLLSTTSDFGASPVFGECPGLVEDYLYYLELVNISVNEAVVQDVTTYTIESQVVGFDTPCIDYNIDPTAYYYVQFFHLEEIIFEYEPYTGHPDDTHIIECVYDDFGNQEFCYEVPIEYGPEGMDCFFDDFIGQEICIPVIFGDDINYPPFPN